MFQLQFHQLIIYIGIVYLILTVEASTKNWSWCDAELCEPGQTHTACNHNEKFSDSCPADVGFIDLRSHRSEILHEHNKRRNFVASGDLIGYYPASRMATLVWDEELEYLAGLNLRQCYVDHDQCRNTPRFRSSGQNLVGLYRYREYPLNVSDIIQQSMNLWFREYSSMDSSYITNFRATSKLESYGHFAQLVVDRNTHVGCAMTRYTNPNYPFLYIYNFGCNYASVYAIDVPVYRVGEPTSACTTGWNARYPYLCSTKEVYNPNYFSSNEV